MPDTINTTAENIIDIATGAPAIEAPVIATPAKKAPVQFMLGCTKEDKEAIVELASKYVGPGVSKEYGMTEKEAINMLWHVANNRRFETVYTMNEDGTDYVYDEEGNAVFTTLDHFELESKRVFALRKSMPTKAEKDSPEYLKAQLERIKERLAKQIAKIEGMAPTA